MKRAKLKKRIRLLETGLIQQSRKIGLQSFVLHSLTKSIAEGKKSAIVGLNKELEDVHKRLTDLELSENMKQVVLENVRKRVDDLEKEPA